MTVPPQPEQSVAVPQPEQSVAVPQPEQSAAVPQPEQSVAVPQLERPVTAPQPEMPAVGTTPQVAAVRALLARHETLATAESLTGGLVAATLVEIPGVSAVFRGGLVVYATELKHLLAGVREDLLAERGPVDPDVALALAAGARERCGADWGVATTGVAGPDPQDGKPVGLVYVAVAGPAGSSVRELRLTGSRPEIRAGSVSAVLQLLAERLTAA